MRQNRDTLLLSFLADHYSCFPRRHCASLVIRVSCRPQEDNDRGKKRKREKSERERRERKRKGEEETEKGKEGEKERKGRTSRRKDRLLTHHYVIRCFKTPPRAARTSSASSRLSQRETVSVRLLRRNSRTSFTALLSPRSKRQRAREQRDYTYGEKRGRDARRREREKEEIETIYRVKRRTQEKLARETEANRREKRGTSKEKRSQYPLLSLSQVPGQVYFIYRKGKHRHIEASSPSLFADIILSPTIFVDHMPYEYEENFPRVLDHLDEHQKACAHPSVSSPAVVEIASAGQSTESDLRKMDFFSSFFSLSISCYISLFLSLI
jgi:hypothetical protein